MVDWSHLTVGALAATGVVLGNVILTLVRRRNGARKAAVADTGDRITLRDLRDGQHEMREAMEKLSLRLGIVETDVKWIKASLNGDHGPRR